MLGESPLALAAASLCAEEREAVSLLRRLGAPGRPDDRNASPSLTAKYSFRLIRMLLPYEEVYKR